MQMVHLRAPVFTTPLLLAAVLAGCEETPTNPADEVFWDSTKVALVGLYEAGYQDLHGGEGCSRFSNADGTLVWAESYVLHSLLDMFEATQDPKYLHDFVEQAREVSLQTDRERNLEDYRGRSTVAWSSTRYTIDGVWAFWLLHDALIAEPLVRFAYLVTDRGLFWHGRTADRFVALAEEALGKYDSLYRSYPEAGEGQYVLEAGFPAPYVMDHQGEAPLPLNMDSAAGRLHVWLWRLTGREHHRRRAQALGRRLRNNLVMEDGRYVWEYFAEDGDALFSNSWSTIGHAAIDVQFAVLLEEEDLVFVETDLTAFARTLTIQRTDDGFLRFVKGTEPGVTQDDPKCGRVWQRNSSTASGRWLPVADSTLYGSVFEYLVDRMSTNQASDPSVLQGLSQLILYYPALGGGRASLR